MLLAFLSGKHNYRLSAHLILVNSKVSVERQTRCCHCCGRIIKFQITCCTQPPMTTPHFALITSVKLRTPRGGSSLRHFISECSNTRFSGRPVGLKTYTFNWFLYREDMCFLKADRILYQKRDKRSGRDAHRIEFNLSSHEALDDCRWHGQIVNKISGESLVVSEKTPQDDWLSWKTKI